MYNKPWLPVVLLSLLCLVTLCCHYIKVPFDLRHLLAPCCPASLCLAREHDGGVMLAPCDGSPPCRDNGADTRRGTNLSCRWQWLLPCP